MSSGGGVKGWRGARRSSSLIGSDDISKEEK
jgi:hypothetical protein